MKQTLSINGPIPAKKNRWHRSKSGGMYFDQGGITAQIAAITWQLKAQWQTAPAENPRIDIKFRCKDKRGDIDNKLSTLLDCMVHAGVIKNDNLKNLSGPITITGEVGEEGAEVVVCGN